MILIRFRSRRALDHKSGMQGGGADNPHARTQAQREKETKERLSAEAAEGRDKDSQPTCRRRKVSVGSTFVGEEVEVACLKRHDVCVTCVVTD